MSCFFCDFEKNDFKVLHPVLYLKLHTEIWNCVLCELYTQSRTMYVKYQWKELEKTIPTILNTHTQHYPCLLNI